jgi:beta-phosphoglucomutase-like phosphatase (HAD superfamily)
VTYSEADLALAAARALGKCLKQCVAIDNRRAGAVASSKGTLSV